MTRDTIDPDYTEAQASADHERISAIEAEQQIVRLAAYGHVSDLKFENYGGDSPLWSVNVRVGSVITALDVAGDMERFAADIRAWAARSKAKEQGEQP